MKLVLKYDKLSWLATILERLWIKERSAKYWTFLWIKKLKGIELDIYSNGDSNSAIFKYSYDDKGNKIWIQFQCVELVRRYVYLKYWENLALKWSEWDAKDWYENRKKIWLSKVKLKKAKSWDIITFQWWKWWHVALVNKITDKGIKITSQNFLNSKKDVNLLIKNKVLKWKETIKDQNKNDFSFEVLLRYKY